MIGSISEAQEMLDFSAKHGVTADTGLIQASEINEAYERMHRGHVKYCSVINIYSSPAPPAALPGFGRDIVWNGAVK